MIFIQINYFSVLTIFSVVSVYALNNICTAKFGDLCNKTKCSINCLNITKCLDNKRIWIWGTVVYHKDSNPCLAAVHDGRISLWNKSQQNIIIRSEEYKKEFYPSNQNGIISQRIKGKNVSTSGKKEENAFRFESRRISEPLLDITLIDYQFHDQINTVSGISCFSPNEVMFENFQTKTPINETIKKWHNKIFEIHLSHNISKKYPTISCLNKHYVQSQPIRILSSITDFQPREITKTVHLDDENVYIWMNKRKCSSKSTYRSQNRKDNDLITEGFKIEGSNLKINEMIQLYHSDIYSVRCEYSKKNVSEIFAATRLIVRRCKYIHYGAYCEYKCPKCLNGGLCHDMSGYCICPPGLYGPTCEYVCDEGYFGKTCSMVKPKALVDFKGILFCLPDPYGCSCAPGFNNVNCNKKCDGASYGSFCKFHCGKCANNESCNIYTGRCKSGCQEENMEPPFCKMEKYSLSGPLTVLNVSNNSCTISWSSPNKFSNLYVNYYYVEYKKKSQVYWLNWLKVSNETTTLTINGLESDNQYNIQIRIQDQNEDLHMSASPNVTCTTKWRVPSPPQIIAASLTRNQLSLTWNMLASKQTEHLEFNIYLSESTNISKHKNIIIKANITDCLFKEKIKENLCFKRIKTNAQLNNCSVMIAARFEKLPWGEFSSIVNCNIIPIVLRKDTSYAFEIFFCVLVILIFLIILLIVIRYRKSSKLRKRKGRTKNLSKRKAIHLPFPISSDPENRMSSILERVRTSFGMAPRLSTIQDNLYIALCNLMFDYNKKRKILIFWKNIKLLELMSESAFAMTYKAELSTGKIKNYVAVRYIKRDVDETILEKSSLNLQITICLGFHQNILSLIGSCIHKDILHLVFNYATIGNLQIYLRQCRTLEQDPDYDNVNNIVSEASQTELLIIAIGIANGLEYLHSKNIKHSQLCSRQVLLDDDRTPKITGLGILEEECEEENEKSKLNVRWLALETLLHGNCTIESNVWSYGIILWEISSLGASPYCGLDFSSMFNYIKSGDRLTQPRGCGDELYVLMYNCWLEQPDKRPCFSEIKHCLEMLLKSNKCVLNFNWVSNRLYDSIDFNVDCDPQDYEVFIEDHNNSEIVSS